MSGLLRSQTKPVVGGISIDARDALAALADLCPSPCLKELALSDSIEGLELVIGVETPPKPWGVVRACPICLNTWHAHGGKEAWCVGNECGPDKADHGDHELTLMVPAFLTPVAVSDDPR